MQSELKIRGKSVHNLFYSYTFCYNIILPFLVYCSMQSFLSTEHKCNFVENWYTGEKKIAVASLSEKFVTSQAQYFGI